MLFTRQIGTLSPVWLPWKLIFQFTPDMSIDGKELGIFLFSMGPDSTMFREA